MKKDKHTNLFRLIGIGLLVVMVTVVINVSSVSAAGPETSVGRGGPGGPGSGGSNGEGVGFTGTPLDDTEKDALQKAILEEYKAYNLYQNVMAQMGEIAPFDLIARSEQQHIQALTRQAEKYGLNLPVNPGLSDPPVFADLATACQAGVETEIEDAALYDVLKRDTTHTDILRVYDNLQSTSLQNHLVEFQTCN
jgi:hypothetical protein